MGAALPEKARVVLLRGNHAAAEKLSVALVLEPRGGRGMVRLALLEVLLLQPLLQRDGRMGLEVGRY